MHYAKDASGKPYYNFAYPTSDYAAAMYAVIGILSWLNKPDHGPIHIEAPLAAAAVAWMYPQYLNAIEDGNRSFADANLWRGSYRTADNRYITLTPAEGLQELAKALGLEDVSGRGREDMERIAGEIAKLQAADVVVLLRDAGVPVSLVQTADEAVADPGLLSLGMLKFEPGNMSCGSPIFGMPTVHLSTVPALNEDGSGVRERGWQALEIKKETSNG
jgi:crotonobetainyl-CoA:carnitine CoA-transferase CaiB-like acyl-CoA transferase